MTRGHKDRCLQAEGRCLQRPQLQRHLLHAEERVCTSELAGEDLVFSPAGPCDGFQGLWLVSFPGLWPEAQAGPSFQQEDRPRVEKQLPSPHFGPNYPFPPVLFHMKFH